MNPVFPVSPLYSATFTPHSSHTREYVTPSLQQLPPLSLNSRPTPPIPGLNNQNYYDFLLHITLINIRPNIFFLKIKLHFWKLQENLIQICPPFFIQIIDKKKIVVKKNYQFSRHFFSDFWAKKYMFYHCSTNTVTQTFFACIYILNPTLWQFKKVLLLERCSFTSFVILFSDELMILDLNLTKRINSDK